MYAVKEAVLPPCSFKTIGGSSAGPRLFMESGLVEKYWSEINFKRQLQDDLKLKENDCEMCGANHFVFSLPHLRVEFAVLCFVTCRLALRSSLNCLASGTGLQRAVWSQSALLITGQDGFLESVFN
jgi:hypothetical protein